MKNLLKSMLLFTAIVCSSCSKNDEPVATVDESISNFVGVWDKASTVRLTITADGSFTAQRWIAADNSYANNYALQGKITRSGDLLTVTISKTNLAHLWSSQSVSSAKLNFNIVGDVVTFSNVVVLPTNLDVNQAVVDRLSGSFTKNATPTTLLPMDSYSFSNKTNSYYPATGNPLLNSFTYTNGVFNFSVTSYDFGIPTPDQATAGLAFSPMGQHAHLIIDGQPYIAAGNPYTYSVGLTDGVHTIVAFLSRSYHESYKNDQSFISGTYTVANNSIVGTQIGNNLNTDEIFGSRPIRTYTGSAEYAKILIDYYITVSTKVKLGNTYSIRVTIDQTPTLTETWLPIILEGLNRTSVVGDTHTVRLELYNKITKAVTKTINQTFVVKS
jgi:hypothetical protein